MSSQDYLISADYLFCNGRRLFTLTLEPQVDRARGAVLFLPAFTEEMNKSRRSVALQARALAAAGYYVMQLDLSGCGDSSGDFSDASWAQWLDDANFAVSELAGRTGMPVILWGLRLGALLACAIAEERRADICKLLLWQPVLNGEQHIDQFLRFELAGRALKGSVGFDRGKLWDQLRGGKSLQVAGYELSSQLAIDISRTRLADLEPRCSVKWLDIARPCLSDPSVASSNVMGHWRRKEVDVSWACVEGEPFWRNLDAPDSPFLVARTLQFLDNQ